MKTRNLHHRIKISAAPELVYNVFMNEKLHAQLTGVEAKIENREGG
ncbi:MAG TPA: hypothetical protein VE978_21940 [Chitinophagales bacterium]|nr:hypothetical protein [Chitinophagales bacterium]